MADFDVRSPMVQAHSGQLSLFVNCEVCKRSVSYFDLVHNVARDKYACPACWDIWYQHGTARSDSPGN